MPKRHCAPPAGFNNICDLESGTSASLYLFIRSWASQIGTKNETKALTWEISTEGLEETLQGLSFIAPEALLKFHKFDLFSGGKQETHTKEKYKELKETKWEKICSLILSRSFNADV